MLTVAVEVPIAALLGLRARTALVAVALINVMTNPALGYVLLVVRHLLGWDGGALALPLLALLVGEVLVILAEWRLLIWVLGGSRRRMLKVALAMNVASACIGLVVLRA